jgi:hypothetical protein
MTMGEYRSSQDRAIAREADAKADMDKAAAEKRADYLARQQVGRGLHGDARAQKGDEFTRAQCTRAGIVNEWQIQAACARRRAADAPLLAENPEMTPTGYMDILRAPSRPITAEALKAREELVVASHAIPVYKTKADVLGLITEANANLPVERPILNQRLREGGGSVSPPVLRTLIDEAAQRKDAGLRSATAGTSILNPREPSRS